VIACRIHDGSNYRTSNNPGTRAGGPNHNATRTVLAHNLVRHSGVYDRHANHLFASTLGSLADCLRHLVGFAVTDANATLAIANHNERAETKPTTTLHDLRDAIYVDGLLNEGDLLGGPLGTNVFVHDTLTDS
jgi:hypothetical protein